jgi:hypothetical protein
MAYGTTAHICDRDATSRIQPEARTQAIAAGCGAYLVPDVVPYALISELRRGLTRSARSIA